MQPAGAFGWTGTGFQSCPCLAKSTPCTRQQIDLTTKSPFISPHPLLGTFLLGDRQGKDANIDCVLGVWAGFG